MEDYLVSLCKKISDSKPTTKETDEKVIREFETVTMDKCKYGLTMSMEELVPIVISNDELLMKFTRIDLFRKVLQDLPLMKRYYIYKSVGNQFSGSQSWTTRMP